MSTLFNDSDLLVFSGTGNPFKMLRAKSGLSQHRLANRIGISKHAVLRNEQSMFTEPLPQVMNWAVNSFPVGRVTLLNQYEISQIANRQDAGLILGPLYSRLTTWRTEILNDAYANNPLAVHPLYYLRLASGLNLTALAVKVCVNQSVLTYWEKNPMSQRTVPEQFTVALRHCGYSPEALQELAIAYRDYREWLIHHRGVKIVEG